MRGDEFLDWLDRAAEGNGDGRAAAKSVRDLIDALGNGLRAAVETKEDDDSIAHVLTAAVKSRIDLLDAVARDGAELFTAYGRLQPGGAGPKPAFHDWLQSRKQQGGAEEESVKRLEAFLKEPGRDQLRDSVLNQADGDALRSAVASARKKLKESSADIQTAIGEFTAAPASETRTASTHFLNYLATLDARGDKDAQQLRKLLTGSSIERKILGNDVHLHEILSVIEARAQGWFSGVKKAQLKTAAVDYFTNFCDVPTSPGKSGVAPPAVKGSKSQMAAIGAIILATMAIIGFFLVSERRLMLLSEIAPARGFITFIFTVGTIALFLVITAATVFDSRSGSREQYERAKTILTMLIGIFGTVLGVYFGLSDDNGPGFTVRPLEVAASEDGTVALATSVDGGQAPYTFYVKVLDANGAPTDHATFISSASGALARSLSLGDLTKNGPTDVTIAVHAEDARNTKSATETAMARLGQATSGGAKEQTVSAKQ